MVQNMSLYQTVTRYVLLCCMLVLLAVPFTALPVAAAAHSGSPDFARIDAFVNAQTQANSIPGVTLGIVHGDQVVHLHGFGTADSTGRAVTPHTPFVIGSLTKSFTALAMMQLVEAGKVELDAPVQRYLPWFRVADPSASARITVRQLLNQTSGIPEADTATGSTTVEQQVRALSTVALDRPVGSSYEYANANYDTLGLVVQAVSGVSYETYIQQHIFAPLAMHDSFASEQRAMQDGLAQGYHWLFGLPSPAHDYRPNLLPAGFLISSAEDMSHYLIAQMNDGRYGTVSVLSPTGIATLHAPAVAADASGSTYGMGWINLSPQASGIDLPLLWHSGDTDSFHAEMFIEPKEHWGGIVLINATGNNELTFPALQRVFAGVANLLLVGREPAAACWFQGLACGLSVKTLYLIIDSVLVLIAAFVLWSALRLPWWYKKMRKRSQHRLLRGVLPLVYGLVLSLVLFIGFPLLIGEGDQWHVLVYTLPDLSYWLLASLALLVITGIIKVALTVRLLRRKEADTALMTPTAPSPSLT
jgi:CubicO group peptidase (beta-lactamase class C family)